MNATRPRPSRVGCLAEVHQRRDVGARMEQLVKSGTASQIRSAEAIASHRGHRDALRDGGRALAAPADRTRRGAAGRVPARRRQRRALFAAAARPPVPAAAGARDQDARGNPAGRADRGARLPQERERIDRSSHFDLSLPADHVVWSVAASPGSTVSEGQTVLDLASCSRRFVAVELPEREFERIKVGAPAFVRLIGSDRSGREGQVRQVRGSAARADDRLLAAQVPQAAAEQHHGRGRTAATTARRPTSATSAISAGSPRFGSSARTFAFFDGFGKKLRQLADRLHAAAAATERVASN